MGKFVFGMMQSLDGYVAGGDGQLELPEPGIALFRYWIDFVHDLAGSLYGRRMYQVMRYWDEDRPEWDGSQRVFAAAWRAQPKHNRNIRRTDSTRPLATPSRALREA